MKNVIRILVALLVVIVLGLGIWLIFFKEKEDVQAYNRTSELVDYKQSLGLSNKLLSLKGQNYYGDSSSNVITNSTEVGSRIIELRSICFSDSVIVVKDAGNNPIGYYDSYLVLDSVIDDAISYYLPYINGDKSNSKALKNVKSAVSEYMGSLNHLDENISLVVDYQKSIDGGEIPMQILKEKYEILRNQYRASIKKGAKVVLTLLNYVDVAVFSDNYIVDAKSALFDAFARQLYIATNVELTLESDFKNDVHVILNKLNAFKNGVNIYSVQYNEYSFLKAYNTLFNSNSTTLDYVFGKKNIEKGQMASGSSLSEVAEKYRGNVTTILNVLGFGA